MISVHAVSALRPAGPIVNQQIPAPVPGPGEVLVEVHAVGLTAGELAWPESWPAIPGHEISGVVTGLGPGVTGTEDGRILRVSADGGVVELLAMTGGRPLGLELAPDGSLVVCDASRRSRSGSSLQTSRGSA